MKDNSAVRLSALLVTLLLVSSTLAQTTDRIDDLPALNPRSGQMSASQMAKVTAMSLGPGLVNGKRELICPHSSARALDSFAADDSNSSRVAKSFYSGKTGNDWAFLSVGHGSVPTLMPDGHTLDPSHPNTVEFVVYNKPNGRTEKSFWARRFDSGDVVTTGGKLADEGVDDFAGIASKISTMTFCVIYGQTSSQEHLRDVVWTNTIFFDDRNVPVSRDLSQFRTINEQLLRSLPPGEVKALSEREAFFITTAKTDAGDEIITNFSLDQSSEAHHLIGYMHTVTNDPVQSKEMVDRWFAELKPGAHVYIYGPEIKFDFYESATRHNVKVIRRGPTVVKDFLRTDHQLQSISNRLLNPKTTAVLNGIPGTREALVSMAKPSSDVNGWRNYRAQVDEALAGHFAQEIGNRRQLINELTAGSHDVVFLIAHFDGDALYFGEEKITMAELEALENKRPPMGRPRVGVLVVCNAGVLSTTERSLFRKQMKSVGELFIRKGFFEQIVAPQHEIQDAESLSALTEYLTDNRIQRQDWVTLAENQNTGKFIR